MPPKMYNPGPVPSSNTQAVIPDGGMDASTQLLSQGESTTTISVWKRWRRAGTNLRALWALFQGHNGHTIAWWTKIYHVHVGRTTRRHGAKESAVRTTSGGQEATRWAHYPATHVMFGGATFVAFPMIARMENPDLGNLILERSCGSRRHHARGM